MPLTPLNAPTSPSHSLSSSGSEGPPNLHSLTPRGYSFPVQPMAGNQAQFFAPIQPAPIQPAPIQPTQVDAAASMMYPANMAMGPSFPPTPLGFAPTPRFSQPSQPFQQWPGVPGQEATENPPWVQTPGTATATPQPPISQYIDNLYSNGAAQANQSNEDRFNLALEQLITYRTIGNMSFSQGPTSTELLLTLIVEDIRVSQDSHTMQRARHLNQDDTETVMIGLRNLSSDQKSILRECCNDASGDLQRGLYQVQNGLDLPNDVVRNFLGSSSSTPQLLTGFMREVALIASKIS